MGGADKYTALCRHCFRRSDIGTVPLNKHTSTDSNTLPNNKRYGHGKPACSIGLKSLTLPADLAVFIAHLHSHVPSRVGTSCVAPMDGGIIVVFSLHDRQVL